MDWLPCSLVSLLLYALWAVASKQAQTNGLNNVESQSLTTCVMFLIMLTKLYYNRATVRSPFDLPVLGASLSISAGLLAFTAGSFFSAALSTGDGSTVAAISGSYPAISFLINVALGFETISNMKLLGLAFALASTACFSMA